MGKRGNPREFIFQYYYPKFKPAAEKHGQGVNGLEIVWAQNQRHKLYRDGTLYALNDRQEKSPIKQVNQNLKGLPQSVTLNDESYWDLLKRNNVEVIGAIAPKSDNEKVSPD